MGITHIERLFNPESVAVVGAGERQGSIGRAVMENLVNGEFPGRIYPVNPKYDHVMGYSSASKITDIEEQVDMAVIAVPIAGVPEVVDACGEKGIAGAVVLSAGGREAGKAGREIEAKIMAASQRTGIRIIGPNCLGIVNTGSKLNAGFAQQFPLPGRIAFLSQSGAVCTSLLDMALKENVGFSHFVSLGSMMDVDFADMIDYLGTLRTVESILLYVETLTDVRKFMSAARSVSRVKPIIALKAGRSPAGARAAASHTGALAGEDTVYDAAFQRAGILRVGEFQELFDCAEFLAKQTPPQGPRLAIVTNSGGPGVMAADALAAHGLSPAELSMDTLQKLDGVLPASWSRNNPVDVLGDAGPERYLKAVRICMASSEADGLLLLCSPVRILSLTDLAESLVPLLHHAPCPVFTAWLGGRDMAPAREILNRAGIITFDSPERAVKAFVNLHRYSRNIEALQEIPIRTDRRLLIQREAAAEIVSRGLKQEGGVLVEPEAKALLNRYGIPVNRTELAVSAEHAAAIADGMTYPLAMKICSPRILHKSDAGGVLLNLSTRSEVLTGFHQIMSRAAAAFPEADRLGVSLQPMVTAPDYELIVGARRDRDFGPVLLFGMGGVLTEIFRDMVTALPPLNRLLARRMLGRTKISRVMQGYRNIEKIDMELLEETLIRLSRLVTDFPEIQEMDINPLVVKDGRFFAVDARVILSPLTAGSAGDLVISPYPFQYEARASTIDGQDFFIRPIRPSDASLLIAHFNALSPRSVYMRFFSPIKQLSHTMLVRMTQIDYDREIALVALVDEDDDKAMAGVARVIFEPDGQRGEFSVAVADQWQGKGMGAALLRRCLIYAADRGLKQVWGIVIAENRQMIRLAKKLGFTLRLVPGASEYDLEIDLTATDIRQALLSE